MRVIDLLNKIADGAEVPEKIRINNIIYEYRGDDYLFIDNDNNEHWLFSNGYVDKFGWLNSFLKAVIEEPQEHKIPEKIEEEEIEITMAIGEQMCANKINEIIDYLEEENGNLERYNRV